MTTLSDEFKRKIAAQYTKRKQNLDQLDPNALQQFTNEVLEAIKKEKTKTTALHDIEVLEQSMKHLKKDSAKLADLQPNTDDYDFTRNDCRNLLNATKRWFKIEGLI